MLKSTELLDAAVHSSSRQAKDSLGTVFPFPGVCVCVRVCVSRKNDCRKVVLDLDKHMKWTLWALLFCEESEGTLSPPMMNCPRVFRNREKTVREQVPQSRKTDFVTLAPCLQSTVRFQEL